MTITAGVSTGRNLYFTSPHRGTFCNFSGNPHSWECHHFQAVHHFAAAACWEKPIILIFRSQWKPSTRAEAPRPLPPFTTCWLSPSAQIQRARLLPDSCWIPHGDGALVVGRAELLHGHPVDQKEQNNYIHHKHNFKLQDQVMINLNFSSFSTFHTVFSVSHPSHQGI